MRWFKNLKVAGKLALIGLAFAACMLISTLVTHGTMSRVQVNGPLYEDIVRNKDVLADVLPPPEYILETHLVAYQMLESPPSELDALVKRAQQLKADFVDRHQHWASALPAGAVRDTLLDKSQPPALRYFDLLEKPFLDALHSENRAAARALLLGAMSDAYAEHRAAIDKVVELTNAESAQLETDAAAEVGKGAIRVIAVNGAGLLVVVAFMAALAGAIRRPLERAVNVLRRVAEGDFTQALDLDTKDEMGVLAQELNRAVTSVRTALLEVQNVSRSLAAASEQLSSASQDISSGAQEQAASLEQAAASLKELSSTVKQNADSAQNAQVLASGARDVAEKGGRVVQSAVLAMGQIADSSKRIADIITTIDEIAFQTNLLALNAAVEAARAGDQGRGFAVVAAEVRTLAQRSASAAKETKGLIHDSGRRVNEGSAHVNASGENLTEIVSSVKRVTDMVSEIAAASREQNSGVDQVSTAVSQMNQVTQSNAAQTEELSSTAQTLASQAEHLEQLIERFKLGEEARMASPEARTARVREASRPRGRPASSPKGTHVRNERPPVVTQSRTPDMRQLPPSLPPANSVGRRGFDEF